MSSIAAISPATASAAQTPFAANPALAASRTAAAGRGETEAETGALRTAFNQFVGETLFAQMLKAMRQSLGKPAYFHGGRAEEMFQQQLDQKLAEKLGEATADQFTGPMFEVFSLQRR